MSPEQKPSPQIEICKDGPYLVSGGLPPQ